ncbi:unnamed protein product [Lactuca saligna]|uniref:Uncharacterized protein n=1 Tax=Lactuca saligna TaxID=75948 RepID=A0AA35ZRV7_LACSI|nr:unnamed protein product [Lactuca saligna]
MASSSWRWQCSDEKSSLARERRQQHLQLRFPTVAVRPVSQLHSVGLCFATHAFAGSETRTMEVSVLLWWFPASTNKKAAAGDKEMKGSMIPLWYSRYEMPHDTFMVLKCLVLSSKKLNVVGINGVVCGITKRRIFLLDRSFNFLTRYFSKTQSNTQNKAFFSIKFEVRVI